MTHPLLRTATTAAAATAAALALVAGGLGAAPASAAPSDGPAVEKETRELHKAGRKLK